jgi:hypothetical protein
MKRIFDQSNSSVQLLSVMNAMLLSTTYPPPSHRQSISLLTPIELFYD